MTIASEDSGTAGRGDGRRLVQLWAVLGLECQLECVHCYANAGPGKGFGTMTVGDWERVIAQAAGLGCRVVTFIGGEPTLHGELGRLARLVADCGMQAEVYSNLVHVTPALLELFEVEGVTLAARWYTRDRGQHKAITGGHNTWRQTWKNFGEAARRGIPIRAGIVDGIVPEQQAEEGERELRSLGIASIGTARLREFGRGTVADPAQTCGGCGRGRAAVLPDGTVSPCPMTRWMGAGNVRDADLWPVLDSVTEMAAGLPARAPGCGPKEGCGPSPCAPDCSTRMGDPKVRAANRDAPTRPCGPAASRRAYRIATANPLCIPGACKPRGL